MRRLIVLPALLFLPAISLAQQSARTVSPGMTRSEVIAALGQPSTARKTSEYTYLFYPNDCGKACGMHDLVILRGDSVVDAIFRSRDRHYTGVSSSPEPILMQPPAPRKPKTLAVQKDKAANASAAKPAAAAKAADKPKPVETSKTAEEQKPADKAKAAEPAKQADKSKPPAAPAKSEDKAAPTRRINPPKEANDVRPSIPVNPPTMKPSPDKTPVPAKKPAPLPK